MNRWTVTAVAALAVGLGGAFLTERSPALSSVDDVPLPVQQAQVDRRVNQPAPTESPAPVVSPVSPEPVAPPAAAPQVAGNGAYDDAPLYRREPTAGRLPASIPGVLTAFERSRTSTSHCLKAARATNPFFTPLVSLDVRLAQQDEGTAAVEEVRLPSSNDPALEFRGCLVAALGDQRFEVPPGGFVRFSLPIDLSESSP
jgi:hypothetical protein